MIISRVAILLLLLATIFNASTTLAQQVKVESDPRYGALTWVQHSSEYKLLTRQTYRMALSQLLVGAKDRNWTADEVQLVEGGFSDKKPAVILDCDETVLDNSFYNARNILKGRQYETQTWNDWCFESQAEAIPGALEFVKAAEGLGVKIFYITNRRDVVKDATIKNLNALGFTCDENTVFTRNDDEGRGDDKISRRAMVAKEHRIVLLIGDNMSDLCAGMAVPNTKRRNEVATEKSDLLGSRWIMLPNPVYGSWQRALPAGDKAIKDKPKPEVVDQK
ncbi:MAG: 5'-nucleotidase, lipoprotein e(P4) family [Mariniblastus sp.]